MNPAKGEKKVKRANEPFGKRLSSSSSESRPTGLRMSMSSTWRLSANMTLMGSMPSLSYSAASMAKMCWLKKNCSSSLAKLMQSCSKLLNSKFSKPKMSRMPMRRNSSASAGCRRRSMRCTSHANVRPYRLLAMASRVVTALVHECEQGNKGEQRLATFRNPAAPPCRRHRPW